MTVNDEGTRLKTPAEKAAARIDMHIHRKDGHYLFSGSFALDQKEGGYLFPGSLALSGPTPGDVAELMFLYDQYPPFLVDDGCGNLYHNTDEVKVKADESDEIVLSCAGLVVALIRFAPDGPLFIPIGSTAVVPTTHRDWLGALVPIP